MLHGEILTCGILKIVANIKIKQVHWQFRRPVSGVHCKLHLKLCCAISEGSKKCAELVDIVDSNNERCGFSVR